MFCPNTFYFLVKAAPAICYKSHLDEKLKNWLTFLLSLGIYSPLKAQRLLNLKRHCSLSRLNKRRHYQTSLSAAPDPFGKQPVSYSSNQRVFLRDLQAGQEASAGVISNC